MSEKSLSDLEKLAANNPIIATCLAALKSDKTDKEGALLTMVYHLAMSNPGAPLPQLPKPDEILIEKQRQDIPTTSDSLEEKMRLQNEKLSGKAKAEAPPAMKTDAPIAEAPQNAAANPSDWLDRVCVYGLYFFAIVGVLASFWGYGLWKKNPMICMKEEDFAKNYVRVVHAVGSDDPTPITDAKTEFDSKSFDGESAEAEQEYEVEVIEEAPPPKPKAEKKALVPKKPKPTKESVTDESQNEAPIDDTSSDEDWP